MTKALTNKTLEALKPTGKRYAVHDAHCPGLSVRVNANGTKTFTASYRYGRKQRRLTIGRYPIISLAEARDKARAAYREILEGVDPQAVRRRKNMNLREGVDAFIEQYAKPRNRSWRETERVLTRELVTRFGERDLTLMTRADILEAADAAIELVEGVRLQPAFRDGPVEHRDDMDEIAVIHGLGGDGGDAQFSSGWESAQAKASG